MLQQQDMQSGIKSEIIFTYLSAPYVYLTNEEKQ